MCKFETFYFLFFVINSTLCHLFESPHPGDSNGMPQRIGSVNCVIYSNCLIKATLIGCHNLVKKISQILVRFSFLSEPLLSFANNIGGLIV